MSNFASSSSSSTPVSLPVPSTLFSFYQKVVAFLAEGPARTAGKFVAIRQLILDGTDAPVNFDSNALARNPTAQIPWNVCELVAGIVMTLASPCDTVENRKALRFASTTLGGLPTMATVTTIPSMDLEEYFRVAKIASINRQLGELTVLGVNLVDVGTLDRRQRGGGDMRYTSFEHTFVLGIGLEGFRMWSVWGGCEYQLEHLSSPEGARLRYWTEVKDFLETFKVLTTGKITWSAEINQAYKKLFDVDLLSICGDGKPFLPLVPEYRPWVRIFEIKDVRVENADKFNKYLQSLESGSSEDTDSALVIH